jgi:hypothetical protein
MGSANRASRVLRCRLFTVRMLSESDSNCNQVLQSSLRVAVVVRAQLMESGDYDPAGGRLPTRKSVANR